MIIRSRPKRSAWLARLRNRLPGARPDEIMEESQFQLAIEKERLRSERRELVFTVLVVSWPSVSDPRSADQQIAPAFRQRLRLTDELGYLQGGLAILLPETSPMGAGKVANDLTEIARKRKLVMETEILVYPTDQFDDFIDQQSNGNGQFQQNGESGNGHVRKPGPANEANPSAMIRHESENGHLGNRKFNVSPLSISFPTPLWKRILDITGAASGIIVLSPLMLVSALAIKLSSRGPVIFSQWREGKDGRLFQIYKFRTMRTGAEQERHPLNQLNERDGPAFKITDDPRITLVGKLLRRSCIDELPQLVNVLKGEMSLVGPRPLPADESLDCERWQRRRLEVLPGMTCIWQVNGKRNIPFDDWMRMDLRYMKRSNLIGDLKLLLRTAIVSVLHRGSV